MPSPGSTGAVPNTRVRCPRPWCVASSNGRSRANADCWGATLSAATVPPIQTLLSCATFSSIVITPRSASTRSLSGREASAHGRWRSSAGLDMDLLATDRA